MERQLISLIRRLRGQRARNYEQRFDEALRRTKDWNLAPSVFCRSEERYETPQNLQIFQEVASKYLSHFRAEDVSQQCFTVTAALKAPLEQALGIPLTFTLGYVEYEGRKVFHSTPRDLKTMLRKGMPSLAVNLHAWLTLPSHEVIDMTFGTTYGVVTKTPSYIGRLCFLHPDKMTSDMQYHPQLIGEDYLERIGCMRTFLMLS
jgi:hypothetical protein